jgi:hypothetical protein
MTPVSDSKTPVIISNPLMISDRLSKLSLRLYTPRHSIDVAWKVHEEDGPRATDVTVARRGAPED